MSQPHSGEKGSVHTQVKRRLKTRHLSMIAIGGCIGSGLFMTSGQAVHAAGPGGALLAYACIGIMVYFLMTSLGEMATYLPISGSFSAYASRFVHPSIGFALGWNYWLNWVITVAADVSLSALIFSYWEPLRVLPPMAWSAIFLAMIVGLNMLSVRAYGESEYWFSLIKVITVVLFIIVGLLTILGIFGGDYIGLQNWHVGDAPFVGSTTHWSSKFLAALGVFLIAGYSFQGTELIGIAAGESEDPEKSIPRAVNQVFWRILIFYIFSIAIIGLIIPYTSPDLLGAQEVAEIAKSPFTIVFEKVGLAMAASVMNAVILTSILSAGNSGFYASTRMLHAMAIDGMAPKAFAKVNKAGTPRNALYLTLVMVVVVFLMQLGSPHAYEYIIAASGLTGFIAWLGIALSHYRFRKAYIAQGKNLDDLVYRAKLFPFGPIFALVLCTIVIIGQDTALLEGEINLRQLATTYLGIPVFIAVFLYHKIKYNPKMIPLKEVDLNQDHKMEEK